MGKPPLTVPAALCQTRAARLPGSSPGSAALPAGSVASQARGDDDQLAGSHPCCLYSSDQQWQQAVCWFGLPRFQCQQCLLLHLPDDQLQRAREFFADDYQKFLQPLPFPTALTPQQTLHQLQDFWLRHHLDSAESYLCIDHTHLCSSAARLETQDILDFELELQRFCQRNHIRLLCLYNRTRLPARLLESVLLSHPQTILGQPQHHLDSCQTPPLPNRELDEARLQWYLAHLDQNRTLQQALAQSEQRYRSIVENITDFVYSVQLYKDAAPVVTHRSACLGLTGYTTEELPTTAEFWLHIAHPDDHAAIRTLLTAIHQERAHHNHSIEFRIHHKRGMLRWVALTLVPRVAGAELQGYEGVVKDITELRTAQECLLEVAQERERTAQDLARSIEELTRSNKMQERFSFVAAHHMREPLRVMMLQAQLLERRHASKLAGEALECMHHVKEAGQQLNTLLDNLLRYCQLQHRHEMVSQVDCQKLIEKLLHLHHQRLLQHKAIVSVAALPTVAAIGDHLYTVLECLLDNALKFRGAQPPKIMISSDHDDSFYFFRFSDNGIGIEERFHQRIFKLFERLFWQYPGTGAGLALCKRVIEEHGGSIWVQSALLQGATFCFTLPKKPRSNPWQ